VAVQSRGVDATNTVVGIGQCLVQESVGLCDGGDVMGVGPFPTLADESGKSVFGQVLATP